MGSSAYVAVFLFVFVLGLLSVVGFFFVVGLVLRFFGYVAVFFFVFVLGFLSVVGFFFVVGFGGAFSHGLASLSQVLAEAADA